MLINVSVLVRIPIDLDLDHTKVPQQQRAARLLRDIIEEGVSLLRLYPGVPTGRVELDETNGTITLHR